MRCLALNNTPHYAFFKSTEVKDHLASLDYYFYLGKCAFSRNSMKMNIWKIENYHFSLWNRNLEYKDILECRLKFDISYFFEKDS